MRVFALFIFAVLFAPLSQAEAACGKFVVVKGNVQIDFAKEKRSDRARVGTEVCAGDSISAAVDSRAKIKMVDNNELNISPETVMKIAAYEYKPEENKKKVLLDVLKGKVRSTVKQKYDGQANTFQVKTKAAVAGVRGTDFIASFDPKMGRLEVITFEGRVEVGKFNQDGKLMPDVAVNAGMMTEVLMGKTAEPPKAVPASELKQLDSSSQAAMPSPNASDNARNAPPRQSEEVKDPAAPAPVPSEPAPVVQQPPPQPDPSRDVAAIPPPQPMMPLEPPPYEQPPMFQPMPGVMPVAFATPPPIATPPPPMPIMQQPGFTKLNICINTGSSCP